MAYYSRRRSGYNSGYSRYSGRSKRYSGYRRGKGRSYPRRTAKKTSWKGKKSGGRARTAMGGTVRSLKNEMAKMALTQTYGPSRNVELSGMPREVCLRAWGDVLGKYYFAVPVTDVMMSALADTGKRSMWIKGYSLDLDLFHGVSMEFFAVLVAMPIGSRAISVGLNAQQRTFSMLELGQDPQGMSKVSVQDLLDGVDPTISVLGDAVFGKTGRDGTYFTSSVEPGTTRSGSVNINGRKENHGGMVRRKFGVGSNVNVKDPTTFAKESIHFWANFEKPVKVMDERNYAVDKYYAILCGVKPEVDIPVSTPIRDKSGQVVAEEPSALGWFKDVKSCLYYRLQS